jgi:hypothetical protein
MAAAPSAASGGASMKRGDPGRQIWPRGKPLPVFRTHAEEERFWLTTDFEDDDDPGVWRSGPLGRRTKRRRVTRTATRHPGRR